MNGDVLPRTMQCDHAERPLRIALVYSRVPFPMMRGDQMTVAHLISFLAARGHKTDFYTLDVDGRLSPEQDEWLNRSCRSVRTYRHTRAAMALGLVAGALTFTPIQVGIFRNRRLSRDLEKSIDAGGYDIVYCYYPRTASAIPQSLREKEDTASFLALQLSQTLNTRRMARYERNRLKRWVYRIETVLMSRFESRIWKKFNRVVLIGPADVEAVKQQCRKHHQPEIDNWIYGAHGTDTDKYVPAKPEEVVPGRVIFSGSMSYPPNIQAVLWFVEHVWPKVRAAVPDATFVIQGRDPSTILLKLDGQDGIWVTGTVPDVGVLIRSAQVCVNPMLAAGGMQNKLIEYMACNKAVVASTIANEGIRAPARALVIADTPQDFADEVIRLLGDSAAVQELGRQAREYVLSEWTWEKHFLDLERAFHEAIAASPGCAARARHKTPER